MEETNLFHKPVLADEIVELLNVLPQGVYVDCTLGGGGHTALIAERLFENGRVIGIDRDSEAIFAAQSNLRNYGDRIIYENNNFVDLKLIINHLGFSAVDGILIDLGVSSYQIDKVERGFSFRETEENLRQKLDMRMDQRQSLSAYDVVNKYPESKLSDIFFKYGEEPFSRRIAHRIALEREPRPIITIGDLLDIVRKATPPKYRFSKRGGTYASKIFRAIRMEVNNELGALEEVIPQAVDLLKPGGRLFIITFHSLEDRIVKHTFKNMSLIENPVVRLITKKPILPKESELEGNARAASAKLRVIEKV
ncbi:MAG: 16S rRNA (cytosine(1402)-N(4))-methyltransferase RsmH [bacterium]|nr:16S rRNA (cytosine(1402)-N(4))-methyltransferase RsmH [bacterium]